MVRACVPIAGSYYLGPTALFTTSNCDTWFTFHLFHTFLLTAWSRRWYFGFLMAGIGELIEYTTLWAFKSFVIFLGTHAGQDLNTDVESLAASYLDDWLFAGGIGVVLGTIFYSTFTYPAPLRYQDIFARPLHIIY